MPAMLFYDGRAVMSQTITGNFYCYINAGKFPFDNHECMLTLESWNYYTTKIQLVEDFTGQHVTGNVAWVIENIHAVLGIGYVSG